MVRNVYGIQKINDLITSTSGKKTRRQHTNGKMEGGCL